MPEVRIERAASKDVKRIGEYRICYYRARRDGPDGPATIYAVEWIVPRGAVDASAVSLPEQR
ncbi:MAG: hypothetical protein DLM62_11275 [Pseudonocardiales bacterium]|nr:MAG: hypothetical protein DLM62_11275 [Pseudonocardiales bacterium]